MQQVIQIVKTSLGSKLKDYMMLTKISLTIMVVFSSVVSYLLVPKIVSFNWEMVGWLFLAGILVSGSANAINQTIEKDIDARMNRTANRPIAAGRMSQEEGIVFAIVTGFTGITILATIFNGEAALIAFISLLLYAFVYTPLKRVGSIAVFVGAIPGALPCLIGWVAGNDSISAGGLILFALQFIWQFPHFWAIAWLANDDYKKVGMKLLPSESSPTKITALQTIIYSLMLVPVGLLPFYFKMSGAISLMIVFVTTVFLVYRCVMLYKKQDSTAARKVMFGSYIYLAIVLMAFLMDKV